MTTQLISLFAETFIHPGCGQNEGAIDLPVARERVTQYPFIAGSSLKGAWRDYAEQKNMGEEEIDDVFGKQDNAGGLLISDARLLLLPVRSLQHSYCQVTCPALLARLNRDLERSASDLSFLELPSVSEERYLGKATNDSIPLFLEERNFQHQGEIETKLIEQLQVFIPDDYSKQLLQENLVILNDQDFKWFVKHALSVQARNVLNDDKQSQNLWYEETLPPDTLMYSLISQRNPDDIALEIFTDCYKDKPYLQVGGNETVGQGWFHISTPKTNAGDDNE